jgi:hypothetical protein
LPDDALDAMQAVAYKLAPTDERERARSLFDNWLPHIGGDAARADYEEHEREVARLRAEAVAKIEHSAGIDAVRSLVAEAKLPWSVGVALADATDDKYDSDVVRLLGADGSSEAQFAGAFVTRRFESGGWGWLEALIQREGSELTTDQIALLLLGSRDHPHSWERAAELGTSVEARGQGAAIGGS